MCLGFRSFPIGKVSQYLKTTFTALSKRKRQTNTKRVKRKGRGREGFKFSFIEQSNEIYSTFLLRVISISMTMTTS
jgi:hypothetical protein